MADRDLSKPPPGLLKRNDVLERPPRDDSQRIPDADSGAKTLFPVPTRPADPVPESEHHAGFCRGCEANQCIPAPIDMCPGCQGSKSTQQGTCARCGAKNRACCWCGAPLVTPAAS